MRFFIKSVGVFPIKHFQSEKVLEKTESFIERKGFDFESQKRSEIEILHIKGTFHRNNGTMLL